MGRSEDGRCEAEGETAGIPRARRVLFFPSTTTIKTRSLARLPLKKNSFDLRLTSVSTRPEYRRKERRDQRAHLPPLLPLFSLCLSSIPWFFVAVLDPTRAMSKVRLLSLHRRSLILTRGSSSSSSLRSFNVPRPVDLLAPSHGMFSSSSSRSRRLRPSQLSEESTSTS